jgi:UDP-N-acetylglucosamine--N-acetylmuramyl-(pentapeptide) pyrophosphoryl-undecaprenol N-acetylglucosamine transferase
MTIVVTGGGSGGHITPILAVAKELKRLNPEVKIVYIGHTGDGLNDIVSQDKNIDEIHAVHAGKFRRYHGEGMAQLLDFRTIWLNFRDAARACIGLWQSFWLLGKIRPNIIFTRGSYVSVPVCLAGALRRVPYITHDSDAIPSLTNKIIAKWAALHAVALPEELYPYPIDKTITVGVPISPEYKLVDDKQRQHLKREIHLESYEHILLVTGGGLGAERINTAVVANAAALLSRYPSLAIVHLTGRMHEEKVKAAYLDELQAAGLSGAAQRVVVRGFVTDLYRYSGAADVVIARGGATNLAELAVQGKTCIIIPNPLLTGGHQLKNTAALREKGAIVELTEEQIEQELRLSSVVTDLLDHPAKAAKIGRALAEFSRPDAARRVAEILLEKAK